MEGPFYYYQAPPLETSLLVSQMDAKIRSGIEFPSLGKITTGQLIIKEEPLTRQLFQKILEGKKDECSLEWRNFARLSWNDQLQYFIMAQELTPEELHLRWQVCVDILAILRTSVPSSSKCDAQVFGSLITALADPHSGIDICIDPHGDNCKALEHVSEEERRAIINDICRKITEALLKSRSPHLSGYFVSKVELLRMNMSLVLMGFQLNHFNLKVKLSLGNRLLVQNSKLLHFYLNYDPRVKHLIVFLRFWTKFHGLSGSDKLNPYAISWLVIVYLANKKIVPSVILLQSLADVQRMKEDSCENPDMIQGWDASFCEDLELINKNFKPSGYQLSKEMYSENEGQNFLNLLAGFFRMIIKTDFSSMVVSPQLGKIVPRMEMDIVGLTMISKLRLTPLTEWREGQWKVNRTEKLCSALSIQDPFNLDMNVTDLYEQETLDKFVEASQATLKILAGGTLSLLDLFVQDTNVNLGENHVPRVEGVQHLKITSVTRGRVAITKDTPYRNKSRKKNSQKPEATPSQVKATPKVKLEVAQKMKVPQKSKAKQMISKACAASAEVPPNTTPTLGYPQATTEPKATPTTSPPKATPIPTPPSFIISKIPNNHSPSTSESSSLRLLFQILLQTKQVPQNPLSANHFQNVSWNDQLLNFYQCQELTQAKLQLRKQYTDNILTILKPILPNCNAAIFGSLLTGLADTHSDIDISIDPYDDNYKTLESYSQKERSQIILKFRQKIADILKQARSPYHLGAFVSHLELMGKTVPLVRFKLSHTNVWVDLSIGNRISVQNSKLILFYLNYDPRVKDMILFLRYWAKFHEISGSLKIKQYAVSLLVLVYLTQEKIIPSVGLLQTLADIQRMSQGYSKTILDWDSSFCSDLNLIQDYFKPSTNHPSQQEYSSNRAKCFLELLKGFFTMIQKTDFRNVVVCPLFGRIVYKSQFYKTARKSLDQLPQTQLTEWKKKQWKVQRGKKFFKALTIQDPFKLDFNVGRICSEEILDRFVRASKATLKVLEGEHGSLLDLFVKLPRIEKVKKATQEEVKPKSSQVTPVPTKHSQTAPLSPKPEATLVPSKASQNTPVLPNAGSSSMSRKPQVPPQALSASQIPTQDHSSVISTASLQEAHQLAQEILTELGGHSTASCNSPSARKVEFQMERNFVAKYVTCLFNHGIIKLGHPFVKQQLKWQLTTLWRNLAIDFLDMFFESRLILSVKYVTTADVTTSELLNAAVSQEAWEECLLDNEMFSKLKQNKNPFHSKEISEELGTKFRENLKNLALPPQKILYKGISVQVDYPFWEKVETGKNTKIFPSFEIHVLIKLKAWRNKWNECVPPTIAFVVQNGNSDANQLAINGLITTLKEHFPAYLEYQLEQWLQNGGDWDVK